MITVLSLVTSVKDYVEIVNKLIEVDQKFTLTNYDELGSILTYLLIDLKNFIWTIFSLKWITQIPDLPIIIPDLSSAMISEISILDGYFHNAFNFLETPVSYGNTNFAISVLQKFSIGLINSFFLFLPSSTSHLITLRRFVMQGLEAGYLAGLGSILGNLFWITSLIFGWRFFVIPWLSLDIFRYLLGFVLLVKYMWDSYIEKKLNLASNSAKFKILFLNFLLALTEQTSIYPFLTNISIGSESSIVESFPVQNLSEFFLVHGFYILGLLLGSLSLLHFTCWFWENPAFKIYMWLLSSFKISTNFYYKILNFVFLYLIMICSISSIPYYGLDYTLTNPLGLIHEDRILYQSDISSNIPQLSFLGEKSSDRNTRRNRGRHGRRERWKRRIRKYRTFDASLYDQGIYDLFSIEDLNYGFDRFWLRRKMRNHRVRFRFFSGSWMRSFKKQLAKPRLESYAGPRQEFFRILFEQVYHPSFHVYSNSKIEKKQNNQTPVNQNVVKNISESVINNDSFSSFFTPSTLTSTNGFTTKSPFVYGRVPLQLGKGQVPLSLTEAEQEEAARIRAKGNGTINENIFSSNNSLLKENLKVENSTLRKFVRKLENRFKISEINLNLKNKRTDDISLNSEVKKTSVFSKRWKTLFSKISHLKRVNSALPLTGNIQTNKASLNNFYLNSFNNHSSSNLVERGKNFILSNVSPNYVENSNIKKQKSELFLSKKEKQILRYRSNYLNSFNFKKELGLPPNFVDKKVNESFESTSLSPFLSQNSLLYPLKLYQIKKQSFEHKLHYYTPAVFRKFSIENNAPYFRIMMKRYFYYYKPTLRWERTMKVASLRKARRKTSSNPRKLQLLSLPFISVHPEARRERISLPLGKGVEQAEQESYNSTSLDNTMGKSFLSLKNEKNSNSLTSLNKMDRLNRKSLSTHNYTIVGKRATRYRYQIYKDVLQHWYYSPFNRFLLKLDIDLFINRQPKSHFLTKNEENLLHLRRFLLSEHYNTLRWYTQMEHYRSMKTNLGGIKSFASGFYNQQFSGTFKKIRHLFAITPSQNNERVLKLDQPLYNESFQNYKNTYQKNLIIHEELLNSIDFALPFSSPLPAFKEVEREGEKTNILTKNKNNDAFSNNKSLGQDFLNNSTEIVKNYLIKTEPIKQEYIKELIDKKDYTELTNFLYKGKKLRGFKPILNSSDFINQEKNYLLTSEELKNLNKLEKFQSTELLKSVFPEDIWITLLKKWKRKINDQEFLKNYLQRRIEKREKRQKKQDKKFQDKLMSLENSIKSETPLAFRESDVVERGDLLTRLTKNQLIKNNLDKLADKKSNTTTGVEKALNDSLNLYNLKITKPSINVFHDDLAFKKEIKLKQSLKELSKIVLQFKQNKSISNFQKVNSFNNGAIRTKKLPPLSFQTLSNQVNFIPSQKLKNLYSNFHKKSNKFLKSKVFKLFIRQNERIKSFDTWKAKERSLNKEKKMRKEFKPLSKKPFKIDSKNYIKDFDRNYEIELQKNLLSLTSTLHTRNELVPSLRNVPSPMGDREDKLSRKKLGFSASNSATTISPDENKTGTANSHQTNLKNNIFKGLFFENTAFSLKNFIKKNKFKFFTKKFKRKKSPQRRIRIRKNRAVIKKRTLNDSLKRELKNMRRYNLSFELKDAQVAAFRTKDNLLIKNQNFIPSPLQRRAKQRKQRFWKQKRSKFAQNPRKYKKRRRSILGKIRILNKQLKRVQATNELKNWWLKNFLPNLRATTDSLWQYEKDRQIKQKLLELSPTEILQRDNFRESLDFSQFNSLQVGEFDYKPLAFPESIRLKNTLTLSNSIFQNANKINDNLKFNSFENSDPLLLGKSAPTNLLLPPGQNSSSISKDSISLLTKNFLLTDKILFNAPDKNKKVLTNPIPFYAGWDDSLRKFVITNRLLSRRESGYEINPKTFINYGHLETTLKNQNFKMITPLVEEQREQTERLTQNKKNVLSFTSAPLKGMNTATTLYWQIPFTTYDPDQFFALGMDGFAPLGWRRFKFRHSILKSWLSEKANFNLRKQLKTKASLNSFLVKNQINIRSNLNSDLLNFKTEGFKVKNINNQSDKFLFNLKQKTLIGDFSGKTSSFTDKWLVSQKEALNKTNKILFRRLKKRYRRVKKHPRTPVSFPSGPLLNQVLPVHYIYIFYKRSRLPRDRYIKRRLVKTKQSLNLITNPDNFVINKVPDFTLRKRVKSKRKYHLKQDLTKQINLIPRRLKFVSDSPDIFHWRPISKTKINQSIAELVKEKRSLQSKQRKKESQDSNNKQQPNIRVKQLRRRVQRQLIRSVWRYKPRSGGFVWLGDYLKLEQVKAPKLMRKSSDKESRLLETTNETISSNFIKTKRKKKRNIQEWQIQPKTYLLEKHNFNVIKKKLEKAYRSNKISERTKQLNLNLFN